MLLDRPAGLVSLTMLVDARIANMGKDGAIFGSFRENAGCKSKKNGRLEVVVVGLK